MRAMFSTSKSASPKEAPVFGGAGNNPGLATFVKDFPEFSTVLAYTPDLPDFTFPFGLHFQVLVFMLFQFAILACVYLVEYLQQIRDNFSIHP